MAKRSIKKAIVRGIRDLFAPSFSPFVVMGAVFALHYRIESLWLLLFVLAFVVVGCVAHGFFDELLKLNKWEE